MDNVSENTTQQPGKVYESLLNSQSEDGKGSF